MILKNGFFFRLTRLVEVYDYKDGMTLISELATGGELLDAITSNKYVTEIEVARIVQQILEGIEYMHSKSIGHLGKSLKLLALYSLSQSLSLTK